MRSRKLKLFWYEEWGKWITPFPEYQKASCSNGRNSRYFRRILMGITPSESTHRVLSPGYIKFCVKIWRKEREWWPFEHDAFWFPRNGVRPFLFSTHHNKFTSPILNSLLRRAYILHYLAADISRTNGVWMQNLVYLTWSRLDFSNGSIFVLWTSLVRGFYEWPYKRGIKRGYKYVLKMCIRFLGIFLFLKCIRFFQKV